MTKNRDKIVNRDISKNNCDIIFFPYRPPLGSSYHKLTKQNKNGVNKTRQKTAKL